MARILETIKTQLQNKGILMQLIVINVVTFILLSIFSVFSILFKLDSLDLVSYLGVSSSLDHLYRVWTWITYMFVHQSIWHLLINMLILYFSSQLFLFFFNAKQLGSLYILGGIGGAFLYLLAYNTIPYFLDQSPSILIGASASVMAILIGVSAYQPNFRVKLFFVLDIKIVYLALLMFIIDFMALTSDNAGGHLAHIGGAVVGLLFGRLYLRGTDITSWISKIIDGIVNFFSKSKKLRKKDTAPRFKDRNERYDNNSKRKTAETDIDKILDKIKISGYASLTKEEKNRLFDASKK